jgi:hypothetical protein
MEEAKETQLITSSLCPAVSHSAPKSVGRAAILSFEAVVLGMVLAALQIADGLLTRAGVVRFGLDAEGNPLLRALMEEIGALPALAIVKAGALVAVGALVLCAGQLPWVLNALKGLCFYYYLVAVLPWAVILLTHS